MTLNNSEFTVLPDIKEVSRAAADLVVKLSNAAGEVNGRFLIMLSGGSTPEYLYQILSSPSYISAVPWAKTHVYWGDERCVPPTDKESNYGQAYRLLLEKVPVKSKNIFRIRGELEVSVAAKEYQKLLASQASDAEASPRFDLVLLGIGADGHTASLFPGPVSEQELLSTVTISRADYEGRPSERVTLTPKAINKARNILIMAAGSKKADAVAAALLGPEDLERWPVQRIRPVDGRIYWLVDRAAADSL